MSKCAWCKQERDIYKIGYCEGCYRDVREVIKSSKAALERLRVESMNAPLERRPVILAEADLIAKTLQSYVSKGAPISKNDFMPILKIIYTNCGAPMKKRFPSILVVLPWVLLLIFMAAFIFCAQDAYDTKKDLASAYAMLTTQGKANRDLQSQLDELTASSATPAKTNYIFENGNFVAGKDFAGGTYNISALSGLGNVSSDNMFDGGINAIMGTKSEDTYDMAEQKYSNVSLPEGTVLTIKDVKIKLTLAKQAS